MKEVAVAVKEKPEKKEIIKKIRPKHKGYNWDTWFKKKSFTLVKGIDYDCRLDTIICQVRQKGILYKVGTSVKVAEDQQSILVKIVPQRKRNRRKANA